MIKRFVLNYIRTHMSHETMNTRSEILEAVNDGCIAAFTEDNIASRISWTVGELVKNDRQFRDICCTPYASAAETRRSVSLATMQEINSFRG